MGDRCTTLYNNFKTLSQNNQLLYNRDCLSCTNIDIHGGDNNGVFDTFCVYEDICQLTQLPDKYESLMRYPQSARVNGESRIFPNRGSHRVVNELSMNCTRLCEGVYFLLILFISVIKSNALSLSAMLFGVRTIADLISFVFSSILFSFQL